MLKDKRGYSGNSLKNLIRLSVYEALNNYNDKIKLEKLIEKIYESGKKI